MKSMNVFFFIITIFVSSSMAMVAMSVYCDGIFSVTASFPSVSIYLPSFGVFPNWCGLVPFSRSGDASHAGDVRWQFDSAGRSPWR